MRGHEDTETDSAADVSGRVPWVVTAVRALPGHRLHVRFVDGTEGEVDASPLIRSPNAGVFAALRDPTRFAEVFVADGVVTWPGGLDLAPDAMYDRIKAHARYSIQPPPPPPPPPHRD
jgi:hypothetical protein